MTYNFTKKTLHYLMVLFVLLMSTSLNNKTKASPVSTEALTPPPSNPPTFTSTPITTVNDNQTYSYTVTASDIDGNTFDFTAPTLPAWLTLINNSVSTFLSVGARCIAIGPSGDFFVSHTELNQILKITPEGVVTTYAGTGVAGYVNGANSIAQFHHPYGIAVDAAGNVYVSSQTNHSIRKILPDGTVSTLAGSTSGTPGYLNAIGTNALFYNPSGISVDASGNVYVADLSNNKIRKILPDGTTTTLAGSGYGFADGPGAGAKFAGPYSVEVDASGNVFVADTWGHRIRKITPGGFVSTIAGNGNAGFVDGALGIAELQHPQGLTVDNAGNVYVADFSNNAIRKISPDGYTQTLAGTGAYGFNDGPGATAIFGNTYDVAVDNEGNVYATDRGNSKIRKIEKFTKLYGSAIGHFGTHTVQLKVTNTNGLFTTQNFSITVSDVTPPSAINDFITISEDIPSAFYPINNDFDLGDNIDTSSVIILDSTNYGMLSLIQATGQLTYSPLLNFYGKDTLQYSISDKAGNNNTAFIYITVTPVNDAPVANNDNLVAFENISSVVDVLANDSDIDMDNLRVFVTKPPSSGGSAYVSSNKITYRSPKGFSGEDVFEYQVCDNGLAPIKCAIAKVFVKVEGINEIVIVDHEMVVMDEDGTFSGDLTDAGDYDPDGSELLATTTPLLAPMNGTLTVSSDGLYSYTPNLNFNGTDLAVVTICDQGNAVNTCKPDSIYIAVNSVNDSPIATPKSITVAEDSGNTSIDISGNVSDIDSEEITTIILSGTTTFSSALEMSYTPAANFNGTDMIVYSVCDQLGACDTGTINITVTPVNDPPILEITIDNVEIDLFSSETIPLVGAFTDVDAGDVLTVEVTMVGGSPLPAWVVYNPTSTTLVCSPSDASHIGIYNLKATATDGAGAQESTTFSVTVQQANTLSGYIYLGDKGGAKSGLITKGGQAGDPAVDVLLVLSHNGVFVDSTRTNNEGYYIFYNLAPLMYDMEVYFENLEAEFEIQITSASDAPVAEGYNFTVWPESAIITDVNIPGQSLEINMYPNPSKGNVILEMGNTGNSGTTVSVYNIAGQKIFGDQFSENRILLNLKNQVSGMYYVKVTTDSSEVIKKLVLSKE